MIIKFFHEERWYTTITHWLFGDWILTCHAGGPDSIPGQCKEKNFVQTPVDFCFACTQNIKIRWTANTMWLYIIILWTCYFILRACSFIGVIRVTSPIDINVPIKSLLALKKNGSFVSLTGSFFTNLNVYKYEILLLRTSLLQP